MVLLMLLSVGRAAGLSHEPGPVTVSLTPSSSQDQHRQEATATPSRNLCVVSHGPFRFARLHLAAFGWGASAEKQPSNTKPHCECKHLPQSAHEVSRDAQCGVHDGDLRHILALRPAPWPLSTRRRGAHTFAPSHPSRLTSSLFTPSALQPGRCHGQVLPILWKSRVPQTVTPDSSASTPGSMKTCRTSVITPQARSTVSRQICRQVSGSFGISIWAMAARLLQGRLAWSTDTA